MCPITPHQLLKREIPHRDMDSKFQQTLGMKLEIYFLQPFYQFSTIKNLENNTFIFYYVWVSCRKTVNKMCVHKIMYLNPNIWKCGTNTCLKLFFKFFSKLILIKWQISKSLQNWISFVFCKTCNFLILNTSMLNGLKMIFNSTYADFLFR